MTNEQMKAALGLHRALNRCHKAGLMGGVFDTTFCVWPTWHDPEDNTDGDDFFESVNRHGDTIVTSMNLDGGAGT